LDSNYTVFFFLFLAFASYDLLEVLIKYQMHHRRDKPYIVNIPTQDSGVPPVPPADLSTDVSVPAVRKRGAKGCFDWTTVAMGALIPLMIGVATVVITVRQQQVDDRRQLQERELDDRRYHLEQRQADELHYQDVYKSFIQDISSALFKQQQWTNQTLFIDENTKLKYIRSQTLTALRDLDWERKTSVFLFLYESSLLPRMPTSQSDLSLDLSGSNLMNITLESTLYNKYQFNRLALPYLDLSESSFINCEFQNGVNFSGSSMNDIKLMRSRFVCNQFYNFADQPVNLPSTHFFHTSMERADFSDSVLCDVSFWETDLSYANFNRALFHGYVEFLSANLAYVNFTDNQFRFPLLMFAYNSNLTGTQFNGKRWETAIAEGDFLMINVILPNGTWTIWDENLVKNGNGQIAVSGIIVLEEGINKGCPMKTGAGELV
jgi:uncharacterized protein YjbI with pentapeptide repeats